MFTQSKRQGGELHCHLRHKVKSYKNRSLKNDRRGQIKGAISIEERPEVVDLRTRIGDWELDTIVGKASGSVLVTMSKVFVTALGTIVLSFAAMNSLMTTSSSAKSCDGKRTEALKRARISHNIMGESL